MEQAVKLSQMTLQPNDPQQTPYIAERRSLNELIHAHANNQTLVAKLESIKDAFPTYRPVRLCKDHAARCSLPTTPN